MTKPDPRIPQFFNSAQAGRELSEVGSGFLKKEADRIRSRWFHGSSEVDLFLWEDEQQQIIRQQICFCGLIVDWNIFDGTWTGSVAESTSTGGIKMSQLVTYDENVSFNLIEEAIGVIESIQNISDELRLRLIKNFQRTGHKPLVTREFVANKLSRWDQFMAWFTRKSK